MSTFVDWNMMGTALSLTLQAWASTVAFITRLIIRFFFRFFCYYTKKIYLLRIWRRCNIITAVYNTFHFNLMRVWYIKHYDSITQMAAKSVTIREPVNTTTVASRLTSGHVCYGF